MEAPRGHGKSPPPREDPRDREAPRSPSPVQPVYHCLRDGSTDSHKPGGSRCSPPPVADRGSRRTGAGGAGSGGRGGTAGSRTRGRASSGSGLSGSAFRIVGMARTDLWFRFRSGSASSGGESPPGSRSGSRTDAIERPLPGSDRPGRVNPSTRARRRREGPTGGLRTAGVPAGVLG